jgi:CBS domain containing-hemolysin-like protein
VAATGLGQRDPAATRVSPDLGPAGGSQRGGAAGILAEAEETGIIEEAEEEMLYKVFDFADAEVREVMVPRPNIAALSAEMPMKECVTVVIGSPYTRHPVYLGTLDNVIGVLHIRDIFSAYHHERLERTTIEQALRPVPLIPETKNLGALLAEFRRTHQQMAIVLDEYGATEGLVTLEDLLEEIVGAIADEYDLSDESVQWLNARTARIRSTTSPSNSTSSFPPSHSIPRRGSCSTASGGCQGSAIRCGWMASGFASWRSGALESRCSRRHLRDRLRSVRLIDQADT